MTWFNTISPAAARAILLVFESSGFALGFFLSLRLAEVLKHRCLQRPLCTSGPLCQHLLRFRQPENRGLIYPGGDAGVAPTEEPWTRAYIAFISAKSSGVKPSAKASSGLKSGAAAARRCLRVMLRLERQGM